MKKRFRELAMVLALASALTAFSAPIAFADDDPSISWGVVTRMIGQIQQVRGRSQILIAFIQS